MLEEEVIIIGSEESDEMQRKWENEFIGERIKEIEFLKEEIKDLELMMESLEQSGDNETHDKWRLDCKLADIIVAEWEKHYMISSEEELYGKTEEWIRRFMVRWVELSSYDKVSELLDKAIEESPRNPFKAMEIIVDSLAEEGYMSKEISRDYISNISFCTNEFIRNN